MSNEVTAAAAMLTAPAQTAPGSSHDVTASPGVTELVIQPAKGWIAIDWAELYRYRELLYFLTWRDIKVRYKQTSLGLAWAILQPLLQALIATLIFGAAAGFTRFLPEGTPYLVFAFVGQLPWAFFSTAVTSGGNAMLAQQHMLNKIYFPRLFLPAGVIGGALFDLLIAFGVLTAFMVVYHFIPTSSFQVPFQYSGTTFTPPWTIVLLPLMMIPLAITALGAAYLLSAMQVLYRDVRFIVPFLNQIWMWMSFVMIPRQLVIEKPWLAKWEPVLSLNPMYGIIATFRYLAGTERSWNPWSLVIGCAVGTAMFVFGLFYFKRVERKFADIA
ncbi:MAG TPA: ABC transporter permease [Tepidisphaeraceae bacterium]|nr:ABC transporter permease [Tepidisphaeraceae bacterium]